MPVIAAVESRRELAGRSHVSIAAEIVADLVGVFLVHARESKSGEALCRLQVNTAGAYRLSGL
jgi:hypothetical protein